MVMVILSLLLFLRSKIADQKQGQDSHEDHGGQCVHGRLDAAAHLTVDQGGQGVDAGASGKVGNDEIIQGHGVGQQKAGKHAR